MSFPDTVVTTITRLYFWHFFDVTKV